MEYILQSPIHCLKVNLKCVLKFTNFSNKMVLCSRQIDHQLNTNIRNLVLVLTKKGKNKFTCPMFDRKF